MLAAYALRGLKAGAVAGLAFGLFVALVASPLVAVAEERAGHHDADHEHAGEPGHAHVAVGPLEVETTTLSTLTNLLGGVGWGLLLGVGFGVAFYLLEPAVPGAGDTRIYLLGAAGLLTVSVAPWLAVPPQPPGVEGAALDVRGLWYGGMVLAGALACLTAGTAYSRLRTRGRRPVVAGAVAAVPLAALPLVTLVAPATGGSGSFAAAYRGVVLAGQVGLWLVLALAFGWFHRRGLDRGATDAAGEPGIAPGD